VAQLDLDEPQSVECWERILVHRRDLSERLGRPVALKTAMVDVLSNSNFLRVPILVEYDELKKLQINAATDALTGLYNRRLFEEYFEKELERAKRYAHQLALLSLDLHRFKDVNDRYGHMQGDQVLQAAASTLRKTMRTSDYAFRIGGDEFALLLPHTEPEQASTLGRRLCANFVSAIEALPVTLSVSFDFGVSVFPDDADQMETLIRLADERLYKQKYSARGETPPAQAARAEQPQPERLEAGPPPVEAPRAVDSAAGAAAPRRVIEMESAPPREAPVAAGPLRMPAAAAALTGAEKRKWERVSLAGTHAHAVLESLGQNAPVLDLSYGGVALQVEHPETLPRQFQAVLNVPILPTVKVNLRKTYTDRGANGNGRVGCAFIP